MKKFALILIALILLSANAAFTQGNLIIDDINTYDKMARPWAQGYAPLIENNTAHIVLPLLPGAINGDIDVEFVALHSESSPVKLTNTFKQTVKRETFTFAGRKMDAYRVYFKLALHPTRQNGEYPSKIIVRGRDTAGNAFEQEFPITLRITDGQESGEGPDVRIESFETDGPLYVGEDGAFLLIIANASDTREARNIALTITDEAGDILPADSDTLNIGTLAAGESVHVTMPVHALAKASAEPHALSFSLSYEYGDGRTVTKSEKRTVDLQQEVRLNHTEAALPTRVTQGENVSFSLTLMNMGKGKLNNILLTFDVPHMAAGGSVLAGSVDPGASISANANLRVDGGFLGDTDGTLTLTWEDGYGVQYEKTLPLSTTVIEKPAAPVGMASAAKGDDAADTKMGIREIAAWGLAGLLLVVFAVTRITSGRKIRKLEEKEL